MMVAEAYATRRPELVRAFTRQDEFHQMFAFDLMLTPWHKESVERALGDIIGIVDETGVAPAWTLNNHDTQRIVTRLGRPEAEDPDSWTGNNLSQTGTDVDLELGARRARALTALAFAVPGSLYLYQGEELGLPEVFDIPDDRREDPVFHLTHGEGSAATAAGSRCRGRPIRRRRSASRRARPGRRRSSRRAVAPATGATGVPTPPARQASDAGIDARPLPAPRARRAATMPSRTASAPTLVDLGPGSSGSAAGRCVVVMNVTDETIDLAAERAGIDVIDGDGSVERPSTTVAADAGPGRSPAPTVWFDLAAVGSRRSWSRTSSPT